MSICTYASRLQRRHAELRATIDMHEAFNCYSSDDGVADRLDDLREKLANIEYDLQQHRLEQWQEKPIDGGNLPYYLSGR